MKFSLIILLNFLLPVHWALASNKLDLLKDKNYFAIIRHAKAPGTGDPANFKIGNCKTQRNLSEDGINQAQNIGKILNSKLGNNFWVYTSQWCRCQDTAKYLGGKIPQELPILNSFFQNPGNGKLQTKELQDWLKDNLSKYHPLVLVTHQVNITELTGIFPSEGEILILKLDQNGKFLQVVNK